MHNSTLCYITRGNDVLMLHRVKKKNDINKDKWIGVGGHAEKDESPDECLLREVKEETGLTLLDYRFRGIVTFVTTDGICEYMCLFTSNSFTGELITCDEGELEWVKKERFPELNFWVGDYVFLDLLETRDSFFSLKLVYDGDVLIEASLDGKAIEWEKYIPKKY